VTLKDHISEPSPARSNFDYDVWMTNEKRIWREKKERLLATAAAPFAVEVQATAAAASAKAFRSGDILTPRIQEGTSTTESEVATFSSQEVSFVDGTKRQISQQPAQRQPPKNRFSSFFRRSGKKAPESVSQLIAQRHKSIHRNGPVVGSPADLARLSAV